MKKNIVVEVPITSRKFINLPAPCTYCGKQIVEPDTKEWKHTEFYNLKHWAPGRKFGDMQLWDITKNGTVQKGSVTVCAPYCVQHIEGVRIFTTIKIISIVGMLVAAIIPIVLILSGLDESWNLIYRLIMIGFFLLLGAGTGMLVAWVINSLIAIINPKVRDYPKFWSGHWGLSIDQVRLDSGEHGIGPVRYFLRLGFLNIESAQRFLATYPDTKVIKGEKLIPINSSAE
jgi:hypothetical protein